jgi:hypothetical protein
MPPMTGSATTRPLGSGIRGKAVHARGPGVAETRCRSGRTPRRGAEDGLRQARGHGRARAEPALWGKTHESRSRAGSAAGLVGARAYRRATDAGGVRQARACGRPCHYRDAADFPCRVGDSAVPSRSATLSASPMSVRGPTRPHRPPAIALLAELGLNNSSSATRSRRAHVGWLVFDRNTRPIRQALIGARRLDGSDNVKP